jgi:hypothetical protein
MIVVADKGRRTSVPLDDLDPVTLLAHMRIDLLARQTQAVNSPLRPANDDVLLTPPANSVADLELAKLLRRQARHP